MHKSIKLPTLFLILQLVVISLPCQSFAKDSFTIDEIIKALSEREKKALKTAVSFSIRRESKGRDRLLSGMAAIYGDKFVFQSEKKLTRDAAKSGKVYSYSSDGTSFYRLIKKVKEKIPIEEQHKLYDQRVAAIISQPIYMLGKDSFKIDIERPINLFNPNEVIGIDVDAIDGKVTVEMDSTKRCDFERTIYTFDPTRDWVLVKIEYLSGGKTVVVIEGGEFFSAPGSDIVVPGVINYQRMHVDDNDYVTWRKIGATITPLSKFDFDDPCNFVIEFPQDAVDRNVANLLGRTRPQVELVLQKSLEEILQLANKPITNPQDTSIASKKENINSKASNINFSTPVVRPVSETNKSQVKTKSHFKMIGFTIAGITITVIVILLILRNRLGKYKSIA